MAVVEVRDLVLSIIACGDRSTRTEDENALIMCYRQFCSPGEFLCALQYAFAERSTLSSMSEELVALRMSALIKSWVEQHQDVAVLMKNIVVDILRTIGTVSRPAEKATEAVKSVLNKDKNFELVPMEAPPMPRWVPGKLSFTLGEVDTLELARQITLRFFRVYRKIEIKEFFKLGWMKKDALNRSPNLVEMTDMFNDVSSWVVNSILRAPEAHRVSFIEKAIDTVRHCLGLSNFQGALAIFSGLEHSAVARLTNTFSRINKKHTKIFREQQRILNPLMNWSAYREALRVTEPPAIPFLGVSLQDLVYVEEGNSDFIAEGETRIVNFAKFRQWARVVKSVTQFKQPSYNFIEVGIIVSRVLDTANRASEDELHALSQAIQPRGSGSQTRRPAAKTSPAKPNFCRKNSSAKGGVSSDPSALSPQKSASPTSPIFPSPKWLVSPNSKARHGDHHTSVHRVASTPSKERVQTRACSPPALKDRSYSPPPRPKYSSPPAALRRMASEFSTENFLRHRNANSYQQNPEIGSNNLGLPSGESLLNISRQRKRLKNQPAPERNSHFERESIMPKSEECDTVEVPSERQKVGQLTGTQDNSGDGGLNSSCSSGSEPSSSRSSRTDIHLVPQGSCEESAAISRSFATPIDTLRDLDWCPKYLFAASLRNISVICSSYVHYCDVSVDLQCEPMMLESLRNVARYLTHVEEGCSDSRMVKKRKMFAAIKSFLKELRELYVKSDLSLVDRFYNVQRHLAEAAPLALAYFEAETCRVSWRVILKAMQEEKLPYSQGKQCQFLSNILQLCEETLFKVESSVSESSLSELKGFYSEVVCKLIAFAVDKSGTQVVQIDETRSSGLTGTDYDNCADLFQAALRAYMMTIISSESSQGEAFESDANEIFSFLCLTSDKLSDSFNTLSCNLQQAQRLPENNLHYSVASFSAGNMRFLSIPNLVSEEEKHQAIALKTICPMETAKGVKLHALKNCLFFATKLELCATSLFAGGYELPSYSEIYSIIASSMISSVTLIYAMEMQIPL